MASITTYWTDILAVDDERTAARFYHPELDILRFFAFFVVFLHHALPHDVGFYTRFGVWDPVARMLAGIGAMGAFGVDVFFVLSSYLITELLMREKSVMGDLDVKSFYLRRALRIWPLYFVFLALAGVLTALMPGQHIGWRAGAAFTFLAGNWWIVFHGFPSSIIFPLWSVSIEEQFYLVWPVVVRRLRANAILAASIVMLVAATATRIYLGLNGAGETQVWCNTFARLDPIAIGILLAILLRGRAPRISALGRTALIFSGIAALSVAANFFQVKYDPLTVTRIVAGYPLAAIGAGAILLAVLSEKAMLHKSTLVYLGRISYGLYVYHILGLMCSDYMVAHSDSSFWRYMGRNAIALTITITLAAASYRWIEEPFLKKKQRFTHVLSRPGG